MFSSLIVALEESDVPLKELFTDDEVDAFLPIVAEADDATSIDEQIALMKTILREHLADILAVTKEVE